VSVGLRDKGVEGMGGVRLRADELGNVELTNMMREFIGEVGFKKVIFF
jgi:hypothetical protein